ncbi:MAG: cation-translocating P-type ATPase [Erysipelotrichaceae bacterium]|nr:cation-translocating P-type ATPase [Erysipelotrichaceae bacterium]
MEKIYEVKGMTCVICKANVEKTLSKLEGVNSAIVSLMDNEVLIDYLPEKIDEKTMQKELEKEGYELVINKDKKIDKEIYKMFISIIFTILLMVIAMNKKYPYIQLLLASIIIILNIRYYKSGFSSLINRHPNMDALVSISSFVSYLYSLLTLLLNKDNHLYFETSAMVLVIVSIGKYLEEKNKKKTTKFIRGLSTLIPMQANLYEDGNVRIIPIEQVKKGDHLLIKPGESIPQDGKVIEGNSNVDESLITGESIPNKKEKDSMVIGGTINIDGQLIIEVNKNANQTTLSKIVSLTKQATLKKIPIERFADKIANYFVVAVLIISLVTFIIWMVISKDIEKALNFSLSVLVISCPCALGLATPSAIAVSCNTATKNNILIRNPEILELAHNIKTVIFDKTGTLTENKLKVVEIKQLDDNFKKVLLSLEKNSDHPMAKAIQEEFKEETFELSNIKQLPSLGIIGEYNDDRYYAGNLKLLNQMGINIDIEDNSYSFIGVGKNNILLGYVFLADQIKESSYEAIKQLNNNKVNTIMATGDNEKVARKIASTLNIKEYHSEVNPQDKQDLVIENKKYGVTAMVGDGINDAVALSSADIAIGLNSGTDIATAAGDVTLLTNNLDDINFLMKLSKKTMRIIKQNMFWALFYNAIFIPVAAGCLSNNGIVLNPMIGSITMSISSIIVISNALRIKNIKEKKDENN